MTTSVPTSNVIQSDDRLEDILRQSDGKILALGRSQRAEIEFSLVRYNSVGTLDLSFGGDGIVTVPLTAWASSVAVQSDGKIVVAGAHYGQSIYGPDFGLVRFNSDGSLDDGGLADSTPGDFFGTEGLVRTPIALQAQASSIAIQSDGKIVAAGYAYTEIHADFALARYNTDGSLDSTFGTAGVVLTQINVAGDYVVSLLTQADGKIVAVGASSGAGTHSDTVAVRYNSDGSLDALGPNAFGVGGIATIAVSQSDDGESSAVLQPDGKIVIAGQSDNGTSGQYNFSFIRLNTNGSLDTGFGGGDGIVTTAIGVGYSWAEDIALQSDGKFVLAGTSWNGTDNDFAIARYNSDGSFDSGFGGGDGIVTTPISNGINAGGGQFQADDFANGVVIQADGNIIVAGTTVVRMQSCADCDVGSDTDFVLVRYIGQDMDNDGVNETVEAAAPNGGDGNNDGTPDNQQVNVTSLPSSTPSAIYLTLASPAGTQLATVGAVPNPSPSTVPPGVQFPIGHLDFAVAGVASGGASTVTIYLPDDTQVNTYYKFGPTSDNATAHWYPFLFDGTTGAVIDAGPDADSLPELIVLHFVDGGRGDDDLTVNGRIVDPGAPGYNNAPPPVVGIAGPTSGVRGQARQFTVTASDANPLDASAGFEYRVDWGDGNPIQIIGRTAGNGAGVVVEHTYLRAGNYVANVVAKDMGGLVSEVKLYSISIALWQLQPDPARPGKHVLVIGGSDGDDRITVKPYRNQDDFVRVRINEVDYDIRRQQVFGPNVDSILVYAQSGDDRVELDNNLDMPSILDGGLGDDRLIAGSGDSVMLGGEGNDRLEGGSGRDILIGGRGADRIEGNAGDDILIAGYTSFDRQYAALVAILSEWSSSRTYAKRVENLSASWLKGSGPGVTVFDYNEIDRLIGSSGKDWFFANLVLDSAAGDTASKKDQIDDLGYGEFWQDIDYGLDL